MEINFEYLKNLQLKHANDLAFISIWNYFITQHIYQGFHNC